MEVGSLVNLAVGELNPGKQGLECIINGAFRPLPHPIHRRLVLNPHGANIAPGLR